MALNVIESDGKAVGPRKSSRRSIGLKHQDDTLGTRNPDNLNDAETIEYSAASERRFRELYPELTGEMQI